jgi:hypothetical protein
MRMGSDIQPGSEHKLGGSHLVEKNEGPDHLPLRRWKRPAHLESTEIARSRHDHCLDPIGGPDVARDRIRARLPAHLTSPSNSAAEAARILGRLATAKAAVRAALDVTSTRFVHCGAAARRLS